MAQWIDIRQIIFPVGYIWMSTDSKSPAELFGGTWTKYSDHYFWCPGTWDGGQKHGSSKISENQLPHIHMHFTTRNATYQHAYNIWGGDHISTSKNGGHSADELYQEDGGSVTTRVDFNFGGNADYWPPHRQCYCWVRTQ